MVAHPSLKSARRRKIPLSGLLGKSEKRWTAFRRGIDNLEVGETVKHMRLAKGFTQMALAAKCGTKQSHISEVENGTGVQGPTYGLLKRIARACDFDLSLRAVPMALADAPRSTIGAGSFRFHVLVRRTGPEQKATAGEIVPDTAVVRPLEGEVVAVGPGEDEEHPLDVNVGDRVLFGKWSGTEVRIEGADFTILEESEILGPVEEVDVSTEEAAH